MKLIDKDALVAEINKRLHQLTDAAFDSMIGRNLIEIRDFLDTIEVKEVDYDKEVTEYLNNFKNANIGHRLSLRRCAKHFFELGMAVNNKAQKGEEI